MKYKAGQSGNPNGRPKGAKNKITTSVKEMIFNALNDPRIGGEEKFIGWVLFNKRNKELFYTWLMKMLPSNVTVDGDLNVTFQSSEKFMPKKKEGKE